MPTREEVSYVHGRGYRAMKSIHWTRGKGVFHHLYHMTVRKDFEAKAGSTWPLAIREISPEVGQQQSCFLSQEAMDWT